MTTQAEKLVSLAGRVDFRKVKARQDFCQMAVELLQDSYSMGKLSDWEETFVDSITELLAKDKLLTERQFETLNKILKRCHPGEEWSE